MTLHTGGKGNNQRQNLFRLTATATEILTNEPYGRDIPPTEITVAGKALGSDGNAWIALRDGTTEDVTPQASVPYYIFTVGQQKYTLRISINNYQLAEDQVNPQANYCVGEFLNFVPVWTPALPTGVQKSPILWSFDGTFVNAWNRQDPAIAPNGSIIYTNDPTFLKNEIISAWWIDGDYNQSIYKAKIGEGITFPNGQYAAVTAVGKFTMFRPKISISDIRPRYFTLVGEPLDLYKLELGEPDNTGAMVYQVNYNSIKQFSGTGRITQLCTLNYSDAPISSFSDFRCDGSEAYEEDTVTPGTGHVILTLQDGPFNIDTLPNRLQGSFQDYIRFRPDAGNVSDNIFVTLGIVYWNMNAVATGPTTVSPNETLDPTGPDNSNKFPFWVNTH
jgi:hypothetical protein